MGPFSYDLNQILFDYTVEVRNRFKGVPEELWMEIYGIEQESVKCKKAKWLSEEALQRAEERREAKVKGKRERHTQLNAEFHRIAQRDKKTFLNEQQKEERKTIERERLEISSSKLEMSREHFMQGLA